MGTPTGGRESNLLPKEPIESFWVGLWLGIRLLLCFVFEPYTGTCGHRPSRQPLVWPGGMRVALEYGQPPAGLSRVKASDRKVDSEIRC